MTIFAALVLGQMIQFQSAEGYAECVGTKKQVTAFYETWKDCVDPRCRKTNAWIRHDKYLADGGTLLFTTDRETRISVAKVAFSRGCWIRFRVRIDPIGSFWIYYHPWIHSSLTAMILLGVGLWIRRSVVRRSRPSRIA